MKINLVILLLGAVLVIEGLPYFAFPEKLKKYLIKLSETEGKTLRIIGFIMILIGLAMIYLFKNRICG